MAALDNMGYSYTYYIEGEFGAFETALTSWHWDLVIFNDENYPPPSSLFDALNAYVQSGGRLIFCTWKMHSHLDNPLWTSMGISWAQTIYSESWTLYPWQANHSILNDPNTLNTTLSYNYGGYGTYGYYVDALSGATALFGATPSDTAGNAIIVVNQANTTIFNGLLTSIMSSDNDADGKRDDVELYENEITYLLTGLIPDGYKGNEVYAPPIEYTLTSGFTYSAFVDVLGNRMNEYALGSENSGYALYGLEVDSSRTFIKVQLLLVEQTTSLVYPAHQALPDGVTAYKYAKLLLGAPASSLEEVTVLFKVSKAWLVSNGLDATDVKLFRFSSGWIAQPTSLVSEDNGFVYYSAKPNGLTYLAIGA